MKLEIIDIILHRNKYATQRFLVLNRKPSIVYERRGDWLIGEDGGVFDFYYFQRPSPNWKAFAGREFDIQMKDGSVIHAKGQWWFGRPGDFCELVSQEGCSTPEYLAECNVFCSYHVDVDMITEWLSSNEPSNNYHKYHMSHSDFGKQIIESPWGQESEEVGG